MRYDWRNKDPDELERHYNPRAAVGDASVEVALSRYETASAAARERLSSRLDIRYGAGPKQTLDVFPAANGRLGSPAPIQIFIHGGYWRALDKSHMSFTAPPMVEAGVTQVQLNYDLCPAVTLDDIVREVREGLVHVYRYAAELGGDPDHIYLAGHSAGAHLAAMLLNHDWGPAGLPADVIKGALLISGIYEPAVVRRISVNNDVRLEAGMAERNDCLRQPPLGNAPLLVAVGAKEPAGWIEQSRALAETCRASERPAEYLVVDGVDHFTIMDEMAKPDGILVRRALAQIEGNRAQ